jgi:kynureninase
VGDPVTVVNLAPHYSRFRVGERVLLTGHSHQAWPDVSFDAQQQAWLDAAQFVDDKWARAAAVADDVREGWRRLLAEPRAEIALGQNTHELVTRLLSALEHRPVLVTTDGEFHTIRRQIDRFEEAGRQIVRVAARPASTLSERLAAAVNERVACVLVSSVLFETSEIVTGLDALAETCGRWDTELLVDAYHHLNVVPFDIRSLGLARAFVVGGGYKYCQLGEGNCFLRVPPDCSLRPVLTGWFAEFEALADAKSQHEVRYGRGAGRFAGATYDPTSHYRAAEVFRFHQAMGLTPRVLRDISAKQVGHLEAAFRALDIDPGLAALVEVPPERRGGFLAIRTNFAATVASALRQRNVFADSRGEILRLGPAPYVSESQLQYAIEELGRVLSDRSALQSN